MALANIDYSENRYKRYPEARVLITRNGFIVNFGHISDRAWNSGEMLAVSESFVARTLDEVKELLEKHLMINDLK